jgi:Uma2 family endonuclease
VSSPAHRISFTIAEYVAMEALSNVKHEYLDGQIYAMAGGTPEHAALAATVIGLLFPQLRDGACRAHNADLRVRIAETAMTTYPDVTVVCGPRTLDPDDTNAVTNPTLLVEILSKTTAHYDRGDKFEHYKRLPSLKQYLLVSHVDEAVELWTLADGQWSLQVIKAGDIAQLDSINATLDVAALYALARQPA